MFTTFDIRNTKNDNDTIQRFSDYSDYRNLYDGDFSKAFSSTLMKIRKRYPLDNTTAQSLININLFWALTDFFKGFITNQGIKINVDEKSQEDWDKIAQVNNFITVLKEVYIDNSRFGNGLFKVALVEDEVKVFSICPDCWIPVFNKGNLNDLQGHILMYSLETVEDGVKKEYKKVEKHHKGFVENEVWTYKNGTYGKQLNSLELEMLGINEIDDFSDIWDDFIVFPTKNSTESDRYFGESDYKRCKSIIEEIMLTVSQNSKIINRHANPKLAGSEQSLEHDPITNERRLPNTDFLKIGTDGIKPEYIIADLQAAAIETHINMLLQFFYILTKTPPQAYGIGLSGNMSGESLKKIFLAALSKIDDIKQVSFTSTIQKVVECAMAFNYTPVENVQIAWGEPLPSDYSEMVKIENERVSSGTQSKLTTIMTLDDVSEADAKIEMKRIEEEKNPSRAKAEPIDAESDDDENEDKVEDEDKNKKAEEEKNSKSVFKNGGQDAKEDLEKKEDKVQEK